MRLCFQACLGTVDKYRSKHRGRSLIVAAGGLGEVEHGGRSRRERATTAPCGVAFAPRQGDRRGRVSQAAGAGDGPSGSSVWNGRLGFCVEHGVNKGEPSAVC